MPQANLFDHLNTEIASFVHAPENRRLRPGTGCYSALFRGSLFGMDRAADVAAQLGRRRVRVLWMGMNPNMPRSLEYILKPPAGDGDYPSFERQRASGYFASWKWDGDVPRPDWNPIQKPKGRWKVYRDVLAALGPLDDVAMANFLPWGSKNVNAFVTAVGDMDPRLLDRLFAFADDLNGQIIEALSPKLLVVPFSLGRSRRLDGLRTTGVSMGSAKGLRDETVSGVTPRFTFSLGQCRVGRAVVPTLYLRHPSGLQYSREALDRIEEALVKALGQPL